MQEVAAFSVSGLLGSGLSGRFKWSVGCGLSGLWGHRPRQTTYPTICEITIMDLYLNYINVKFFFNDLFFGFSWYKF